MTIHTQCVCTRCMGVVRKPNRWWDVAKAEAGPDVALGWSEMPCRIDAAFERVMRRFPKTMARLGE